MIMRKEVIRPMKAIRIFNRSIRDAFKSVGRNFSLSMASILCNTITLIIVAVAIIIAANIETSTKSIESEMNILVYLKASASEDDAQSLLAEIKNIEYVKDVKYVSKEEHKAQMMEYSESFKTILNYLDENPLLDSYIVYVEDIKDFSETSDAIKALPNVETVKDGEGVVEQVVSAFDIVERVTIGIVISLILVTGFLISNTIKLTIYSRKTEIEIMRLVGASNLAIKLPFVFEGFIIGLIGSIVPICVTIYGYAILYSEMNGQLFSEMLHMIKPFNFVFYVSCLLVLIGVVVGMLGSASAVKRYLKI